MRGINFTEYDAKGNITSSGTQNDPRIREKEGVFILLGVLPDDQETQKVSGRGMHAKLVDRDNIDAVHNSRKWQVLRQIRNSALSASDWTQVADSPVNKKAWIEYRKVLRDITENLTDPNDIVWPTPPTD